MDSSSYGLEKLSGDRDERDYNVMYLIVKQAKMDFAYSSFLKTEEVGEKKKFAPVNGIVVVMENAQILDL